MGHGGQSGLKIRLARNRIVSESMRMTLRTNQCLAYFQKRGSRSSLSASPPIAHARTFFRVRAGLISCMPSSPSSPFPPVVPAGLRPQPKSLTDLFASFTVLALQGFGGVLAVVQRELVEKKRWLTREEFLEDWSVAQIMPGPNVVNLCLIIGGRHFGLKGALASLAGLITVPLLLLLLLVVVYTQFAGHPGVAGALRGMGAVAAGLIGATGLKLAGTLKTNIMGLRLCAALGIATFLAIGVFRLPLIYVIFGLGSIAGVLAFRKLPA